MAYPVSDRWERFIRRGFHPITVVDVTFPGQGVVYSRLPVSSGEIIMRRGKGVRGEGRLLIPIPDLFPALNDDSPIAPYGSEIVIRTGVVYPEGISRTSLSVEELEAEGAIELVPMGVFTILDGEGSESSGNATTLTFQDRAGALINQGHITVVDYGGESAFSVLESVLSDTEQWPEGQVSWVVHIDTENLTDITLPRGTIRDSDAWSFATSIAEALGAEVYFGRDGDVHVVPIPGVTDANTAVDADWIIDSGPNGVAVDVRRGISRVGVYNGVVVAGSASGSSAQPYAFVTDDSSSSRTRYGGPFGRVVKRIENSKLTSVAACERAATAALRDFTGIQRSVNFASFANSAMDPGDVLLFRTDNAPDEIHLLDSYRLDFRTAGLTGSTRSVQYVSEE